MTVVIITELFLIHLSIQEMWISKIIESKQTSKFILLIETLTYNRELNENKFKM